MSNKNNLISVRIDDHQKEELELLNKFTKMRKPDFIRTILSLGLEKFRENQNELARAHEKQTVEGRLKDLEIKMAKLEDTLPNKIRKLLK